MSDNKSFSLRRRRDKVALGLIFVAILLFIGPWLWFRYEAAALKSELDSLDIPESWQLVDEKFSGNRLCLDACPSYSREYRSDINRTVALDTFESMIESTKFVVSGKSEDCISSIVSVGSQCEVTGSSGGMTLAFNLVTKPNGELRALASISHDSYFWGLARSR